MVSAYYTDIMMPRLSELLELPAEETEKAVCDMVVDKSLWCRIDRLKVCVCFGAYALCTMHGSVWTSMNVLICVCVYCVFCT